jgi:uncharacterized protein (TIGR02466 family)
MSVFEWFPIAIYETRLSPPKKVKRDMLRFMENYENEIYSQEEYKDKKNITGDVTGNGDIANKKEFSWLVNQVSDETRKYLTELNVDMDIIDLFVQKSWPVICSSDEGYITSHMHLNSHLSVVYYIQKDCSDDNQTGALRFWVPNNHPICQLPVKYKDGKRNKLSANYVDYNFPAESLIIFPSMMRHEVLPYISPIPRYSVSFDISICSKSANTINDEMICAHPSIWKTI